jgi:hypothetical protein
MMAIGRIHGHEPHHCRYRHGDIQVATGKSDLASVGVKNGPGRPKSAEPKVLKPKKRKMSAKGRAAISAAMKARWSKKREGTRPNVKKTAAK